MAPESEDGLEHQWSAPSSFNSFQVAVREWPRTVTEEAHMHSHSLTNTLLSTEVKLYKREREGEKRFSFITLWPSPRPLCPSPSALFAAHFTQERIHPPSLLLIFSLPSRPPFLSLDVKSISAVWGRQQRQEGRSQGRKEEKSHFLFSFLFVQSQQRICLPWSIIVSLPSSITLDPSFSPLNHAKPLSLPSIILFLIFCPLYSITLLPFRC